MIYLTKKMAERLIGRRRNTWDAQVVPGRIWISIPELPPSLNEWTRQHWTVRNSEVDRLSGEMTKMKQVFRIPLVDRPRVQLVYFFATNRRRDPDNYVPKHLLDGLRHAGIIADDNAGVLQLPQPVFKVDRENPRTEVIITEWEES